MHDLLQGMGRNIVFEESPNNPDKRSRQCYKKDIVRVLTNDMGDANSLQLWDARGYLTKLNNEFNALFP